MQTSLLFTFYEHSNSCSFLCRYRSENNCQVFFFGSSNTNDEAARDTFVSTRKFHNVINNMQTIGTLSRDQCARSIASTEYALFFLYFEIRRVKLSPTREQRSASHRNRMQCARFARRLKYCKILSDGDSQTSISKMCGAAPRSPSGHVFVCIRSYRRLLMKTVHGLRSATNAAAAETVLLLSYYNF